MGILKEKLPCEQISVMDTSSVYNINEFNKMEIFAKYPNFEKDYLENIETLYQYSIPNTRLYYPEPFIASPSFIHNDIWYMHILLYWYWLWFIFLFLIVFFFITFLCCLRWCNPRIKPRRETRGVSRSKCGDLITASIPVTWAISIIISESADAIDYYDGFRTTELIIGIRAYQWGWEYYYPKDIDTQYNSKPSYSAFLGNSLKYSSSSELKLNKNNIFNCYKKSDLGYSNSLSTNLLLPLNDSYKVLDSSMIGKNTLDLDNSFLSISKYTKNVNTNIFQNSYSETNLFSKSVLNDFDSLSSFNFKSVKKSNLISIKSFLSNYETLFDLNSFKNLLKSNSDKLLETNDNLFNNSYRYSKIISYSDKTVLLNLISDSLSNKFNVSIINLILKKQNSSLAYFDTSYLNRLGDFYLNKGFEKNLKFSSNKEFVKLSKLNTFQKDDYMVNSNMNKKKFLSYHLSKNLSPFFRSNNLINLSKYDGVKAFKAVHPISFNNSLFDKNVRDTIKLKGASSDSLVVNDNVNNYKNSLWATRFMLKSSTLEESNFINFNRFNSFNSLFNFFSYPDYDFLNKDDIKILDSFLWDFSYNDNMLDITLETSSTIPYRNKYKSHFITNLLNTEDSDKVNSGVLSKIQVSKILPSLEVKSAREPLMPILNNYLNNFIKNLDYNYIYIYTYVNNDIDNSFFLKKSLSAFYGTFNKNITSISNYIAQPVSFINNINFYKNSFKDFSWFREYTKNGSLNSPTSSLLLTKTQNLRSSATELTADYKSLQKVFKLRFDDLRSHSSINLLSSSFVKHLDLVDKSPKFDSILVKNKQNFFKINVFNIHNYNYIGNSLELINSLNNYSFNFPFLISLQSDQMRYIWFDWFSRWAKYEVQQASLAKLGLYGMPKFDKIFEYGSQNANYIDSENYLNRLLMIRKHYYTVSKFSPILTNRLVSNNNSILNNTSFKLMTDNFKYFILINNFNIFFKLNSFKVHENSTFNNIESGINKYGRNFFKLNFLESSLSENYSNLADILVRREFIYRSFLIGYNLKPNLPKSLISNTNNFFLSELKANSLTNEYRLLNNVFSDLPILKNQYKPMRRGISNMIRIQASNIISLPVELRIQVLASSRDIIHSWAIPSAGVKIDCIPGYSSHKILFFLLSGIYWGQCMEVCGRYHHWMPIIVYFMKRDLFFLWCTHFVLNNKSNYINSYSYSNNYYKNKPIVFSKTI